MTSYLLRSAVRVSLGPPPSAQGEEIRIQDLRLELQVRSRWCWAAVASAVARHYDPATPYVRQCAVVSDHLRRTMTAPAEPLAAGAVPCCAGRAEACNQEAPLDEVLETVGRGGKVLEDVLEFDELWRELPGLLCARIELASGRGHYVVIAGAMRRGNERHVIVADPTVDGPYPCPYDVFRDAYLGGGLWTTTYWTSP